MAPTTDLKLSPIITARCVVCGYVLYFDERTVTYRHQALGNFIDPWNAQQCPAYGKEYRVTIPGLVIEEVQPPKSENVSVMPEHVRERLGDWKREHGHELDWMDVLDDGDIDSTH